MKLSRRQFIGASVIATTGLSSSSLLAAPSESIVPLVPAQPKMGHRPRILEQALAALDQHSAKIIHRDVMAIADYALHSGEDRFYLIDIAGGQVIKSYLVSHGKGSDKSNSGYVQNFSNIPGSNASSRGSFVTGEAYFGKHGKSRRLHGLEQQNDLAFRRAIVIHGAEYVDRSMAEHQGRVGRSLGCFAFERNEIDEILDGLGPGRLLFSGK